MSKNLSFARKFIILKKEFSNMRGLNPKGHGKLELRGNRLNFSLNIENGEKNSFYNVIFVRDNESFDLGKIFTDDNYIGRANFSFNYKELEEMGFPIERINGILVTRDSNVLLGGYFNKNDKSIEDYMEKLKTQEPEIEEIISQETEELIEEKNIEEKIIEEKIIEEVLDDKPEPIPHTINTEEEYTEVMSTIFHQDQEEETEEVYIPPAGEINNYDDFEGTKGYYENLEESRKINQKNQTTNYVLNILSFFPYIEPFRINLQGYNWWKIDIEDPQEDKGFLPYFSYITGGNHKYPIIQNTVTANDLMKRYGHYLFGLYNVKNEVKFYVYAVPGRFTIEDHPQRGATGFNTWFEGRDNDGYWLLYIDPISGRIIYPINPMIPIE